MDQQRATALTDGELLDRLSDLIIAKLAHQKGGNCLLSSGSGVRVSPGTPASKLGLFDQDFHPIPDKSMGRSPHIALAKLMGHHIGSRPAQLYSLTCFSANCCTRPVH